MKASQLIAMLAFGVSANVALAQSTNITLQVPVRISGVTDATITAVHVQCMLEDALGRVVAADASQTPLVGGAVNTTLTLRPGFAPGVVLGGVTPTVTRYRCGMRGVRGGMPTVDFGGMAARVVTPEVSGVLN